MTSPHRAARVLAALALLLSACTDGGTTGGQSASLALAVTDAASEELSSFVVEVTAVELRRPSGATVGVLPAPVRVDLATLVDVSQVLEVVNVPAGLYSSATITLDLDQAEAHVVGETTPATLLDGDGNALAGLLELPVTVGNALRAVAGRHHVLELDFDLDQSIVVDSGNNQVFVEPVVVLRLDRDDPKDLFLAGVVNQVSTAFGTIDLELQTLAGAPLRDLLVAVGQETVVQVDGVGATGPAGLALLAALPAGTWLQCYGTVEPSGASFDAAYVEAGSGTYNGGTDIVEGLVIDRVGGAGADPVLTVLGHSNDASHSTFFFDTEFTVSASFADTRVLRRGSAQAFDTDDLNVGQRVRVFGTLNGFTLDASTAGSVVRLQKTRVLGFASGVPAGGELGIDLERVELRAASAFDWSDGGATPADPDDLRATAQGLIGGLGITTGTAVVVEGFFSPVDDDGSDFVATAVVNRDTAPSLLVVHDRSDGLVVTPTVSDTAITLAIAGTSDAGELALIDRGFVGAQSLPDDPAPSVVPAGAAGLYFLRDRTTGAVSLQLDFAAFAQSLDALLAQGAVLYNLGAVGAYDAGTNTMTTGFVVVTVD